MGSVVVDSSPALTCDIRREVMSSPDDCLTRRSCGQGIGSILTIKIDVPGAFVGKVAWKRRVRQGQADLEVVGSVSSLALVRAMRAEVAPEHQGAKVARLQRKQVCKMRMGSARMRRFPLTNPARMRAKHCRSLKLSFYASLANRAVGIERGLRARAAPSGVKHFSRKPVK